MLVTADTEDRFILSYSSTHACAHVRTSLNQNCCGGVVLILFCGANKGPDVCPRWILLSSVFWAFCKRLVDIITPTSTKKNRLTMKFSTAFLLVAPAVAFTPAAPISRTSALQASTEAATEKVRNSTYKIIVFHPLSWFNSFSR
jgi:hypothetical protein